MSTNPTPRAWEENPFWQEVVHVLTGGKKLRSEHYLDKLSAEDLEQLRLALSCSGTYAEQQKLCPPRRGGSKDGELPNLTTLSEIAQAMRQTGMLRELERRHLIDVAAKKRCGQLGLNNDLTNAVVQIVGEEALLQETRGVVGDFTLKAAQVLMARESGLTKAKLEERKLEHDARRIALLEKKAEQADAARKVTENGELTPEQRDAEYRRIFGMS